MKSTRIKRIAVSVSAVSLLLVLVLGVHIYLVTRPHAIDPKTILMARIDIKQPIDQQEADRIITWMNAEPGVNHALVNPETDRVVFTFFPVRTSADKIVSDFKSAFDLRAERFIPSAAQMKGGCPMGFGGSNTSFIYKAFSFFK